MTAAALPGSSTPAPDRVHWFWRWCVVAIWVVAALDLTTTWFALGLSDSAGPLFGEANPAANFLLGHGWFWAISYTAAVSLLQSWFLTTRFWSGTIGEPLFRILMFGLLVAHIAVVVNNFALLTAHAGI